MQSVDSLKTLKARLRALETCDRPVASERFRLGASAVDAWLGEGLSRTGLHDVYAVTPADATTALAFSAGLATRAVGGPTRRGAVVWVMHDRVGQEAGQLHGPGLHALGLSPERLVLVRAGNAPVLLAAAEEALRNAGVGVVLVSVWGEHAALSLTASRRLSLAAAGGTTCVLTRMAATPAPSSAESRWGVRSVASTALDGDAPGAPAFAVSLLRHRGGGRPREWIMEWNREGGCFVEPSPLSGGVVSLPVDRSAEAVVASLRRLGRRAG